MPDTVLVTGFGPFLSYDYNPSGAIAKRLDGKRIAGKNVVGRVLKVGHIEVGKELEEHIREHKPSIVIALGLNAASGCISLERVAINRYYYKDADGEIDEPLRGNGPAAYFSTLPLAAIKKVLQGHGIPAEFSFSSDTYVSNETFYELMRLAYKHKIKRAGFVHVPLIPKQVVGIDKPHYTVRQRIPSMDEGMIEKAVGWTIQTC